MGSTSQQQSIIRTSTKHNSAESALITGLGPTVPLLQVASTEQPPILMAAWTGEDKAPADNTRLTIWLSCVVFKRVIKSPTLLTQVPVAQSCGLGK